MVPCAVAAPAVAASPRQTLTQAAFFAPDKPTALAGIAKAEAEADAILVRAPGNREAMMVRAMAIGYRANLSHSRSTALTARKLFEALAASEPRDPEAHTALGGWHIGAVAELGGLVAGAALGAKKSLGLVAIDRAVALGGSRAMFPGFAALLRVSINPKDARAIGLAEAASRGTTPHALDKVLRRSATALLVPLRAGDTRGAQALAKQLLPFGRIVK